MLRYTIKKIGYGVLPLFGVVTVIFYLFHFLPGDPARMMLGQNESAEQLAAVKKKVWLRSAFRSAVSVLSQ